MSKDNLTLRQNAMGEVLQRKGANRTLATELTEVDVKVADLQDKLEKAQKVASEKRRKFTYNDRAISELYQSVTALNEAEALRSDGDEEGAKDLESDAEVLISMYTGRNSITTSNRLRDGYSSH